MGANRKKYAIEQCALYNLTTKRRLEEKLLLQSGELKGVMRGVTYRDFQIPKKSGSFRQVSEPNKRLKLVQKRVLWLLERGGEARLGDVGHARQMPQGQCRVP